jgi:hypothetical protein
MVGFAMGKPDDSAGFIFHHVYKPGTVVVAESFPPLRLTDLESGRVLSHEIGIGPGFYMNRC